MNSTEEDFDLVVTPKKHIFDVNLLDLIRYRDLLRMFIKRDIVTVYKQTILGPIWFFIQPIMTMAIYVVVFGNIAGIPTDDIPQPLFYLSGIILWNYFNECFSQTADTFVANSNIFGKVYFPRLIVPLSKVVSALIKFFIQSALFIGVYIFYLTTMDVIRPNATAFLIPIYIILMAGLGLGFGIIFTSLTTKYRDLKFLLQFGVQLLMYATPIIYPLTEVTKKFGDKAIWLKLNPITHIIEAFKYGLLGKGQFSIEWLAYSSTITLLVITFGVLIFNKTEQSFMDTV